MGKAKRLRRQKAGLTELGQVAQEPSRELSKRESAALLGYTPGSIECEECGDELLHIGEVDVADVEYLEALFVANCPKCDGASSQECFSKEAADVMRTRLADEDLHGVSEQRLAPRKFVKR